MSRFCHIVLRLVESDSGPSVHCCTGRSPDRITPVSFLTDSLSTDRLARYLRVLSNPQGGQSLLKGRWVATPKRVDCITPAFEHLCKVMVVGHARPEV